MFAQMQGIIKGARIELEHETALPYGAAVLVSIMPQPKLELTLEEKRRLTDSLCGTWAGDPSINTIFAEIEHHRTMSTSREVNFDVASGH